MRYQAAPLPDDAHVERIIRLANPPQCLSLDAGGPGGNRTPNLAVMSGRLYR